MTSTVSQIVVVAVTRVLSDGWVNWPHISGRNYPWNQWWWNREKVSSLGDYTLMPHRRSVNDPSSEICFAAIWNITGRFGVQVDFTIFRKTDYVEFDRIYFDKNTFIFFIYLLYFENRLHILSSMFTCRSLLGSYFDFPQSAGDGRGIFGKSFAAQ